MTWTLRAIFGAAAMMQKPVFSPGLRSRLPIPRQVNLQLTCHFYYCVEPTCNKMRQDDAITVIFDSPSSMVPGAALERKGLVANKDAELVHVDQNIDVSECVILRAIMNKKCPRPRYMAQGISLSKAIEFTAGTAGEKLPHSPFTQACSNSTSAPLKSFGCRNRTGFPCAPIFGFPSPSTRAPLAMRC